MVSLVKKSYQEKFETIFEICAIYITKLISEFWQWEEEVEKAITFEANKLAGFFSFLPKLDKVFSSFFLDWYHQFVVNISHSQVNQELYTCLIL